MKITDHSEELLVVDDKPWTSGLMFGGFGLLFGVIGVSMLIQLLMGGLIILLISAAIFAAFYFLVERSQTVFSRSEGTVEFRKRSLHRYSLKSYPLSEIQSVFLREKGVSTSSGGGTTTFQINLVRNNDQDMLPLTNSFSTGKQYHGIAETITEWINAYKADN